MRLHIMPFGAPAWERRREILKEKIKARPGPPYDYRDGLYLVPNERSVRTMRALFLDALRESTGSRACIPPTFSVLNKFLKSRVAAASDKPVIDGLSRTLALEEAVKRAAARMGGLKLPPEILGPSLAPIISDALDKLYLYSVDAALVIKLARDSLPVEVLLRVKEEYERWLRQNTLADLSLLKAGYTPDPDDFRDKSFVVLDGFYDADPAETRLMSALAEGRECDFILEAPGLSREAARADGMPYSGAVELIDALMGGRPGPLPENEPAGREAGVLCRAVFEGGPLRQSLADIEAKPLGRKVRIVGALNSVEEVYFIAREIKGGFLRGELKDLNRVLVFFPHFGPYLPIIKEAFDDYGIGYHISEGEPLTGSPVVTAIWGLLSAPVEDYSFRSMRKIFTSPLIRLTGDGNFAETFDRFARYEGITSGRRRWQKAVSALDGASEHHAARAPLQQVLSLLEPFDSGPRGLGEWVDIILKTLDASGLTERVRELRESHPELAAGLEGFRSGLSGIKEAAARAGGRASLGEFLNILSRAIGDQRLSGSPGPVAGVRVLSRLELMSEPFDVIFAGGLVEGALPRPVGGDVVLTEGVARLLGVPGPSERLTRDARLFLRLSQGAPVVYLSYPEDSGRGSGVPSPYIRALEPFVKAGSIGREEKWCRPVEPWTALGPAELIRSLALGLTGEESDYTFIRAALDAVPLDASGVRMASQMARKTLSPAPEGGAQDIPDTRRFTVTELEQYMLCHYRYYQDRVAGSAPPEEPEDDIAPHKAGSIIHKILRDFYVGGDPVTYENKITSLERLKRLARERFDRLPDTLKNRELLRRFTEYLAPRFIETEAYLALTGYRVCQTERMIEVEVPDTKFGHITITGKIDRVEMDEGGNFNVVDYKTGSYPGSGKGRPLGDQFQLPVYAYMLGEKDATLPAAGKPRPAGFVYYDLKGKKMRDVVAYDYEVYPASGKKPSPKRKKSREEMEGVVRESFEKALEAARGILEGDFRPTCDKSRICESCLYAVVCEKSVKDESGDKGKGGESGED